MSGRKAHGIVYTPDDLARHMVDRTLGAYLREHAAAGDYEAAVREVTVLDPACGDGAFLVPAFELLLAERCRLAPGRPAAEHARQVLARNIYGADLDPAAVEAARRRLGRGLAAAGLDRTIVCGDSLIGDPAVAGARALDWRQRFGAVLAAGGFHVVVGNPPYVSARNADPAVKRYLRARYPQLRGAYDLYVAFLLRGRELLRPGGRYGWIVPNKFLIAGYAGPARELLAAESLQEVVDVSAQAPFRRVGVYPVMLFGQQGRPGWHAPVPGQQGRPGWQAPVPGWQGRPGWQAPVPGRLPTLAERGFRIHAGTTGFAAHAVKALLNTDGRGIPFAVSGSVDPYQLDTRSVRYLRDTYDHPHVELGSPAVAAAKYRFWLRPKIVVAGLSRRIEAVYVPAPLALGVGAYGICELPGYDPYPVTAVLNSSFMAGWVRAQFRHAQLGGGYLALNKSILERLPMPSAAALAATGLAALSRRLHAGPSPALAAEADAIIDRLFGLSS